MKTKWQTKSVLLSISYISYFKYIHDYIEIYTYLNTNMYSSLDNQKQICIVF
jgi:hypothetical protein